MTQKRKGKMVKGPVTVRTPKLMLTSIEKAQSLTTDEDIELIGLDKGFSEAGTIAQAIPDVYRLLFQALVQGRQMNNTEKNRKRFAQAQLLTAELAQTALIVGWKKGKADAERDQD